MSADADRLLTRLSEGEVTLEPLAEHHMEPLRAACAADTEIWEIYPFSMLGEHFDRAAAAMRQFHQTRGWSNFAVLDGGRLVGMTNYIGADPANRVVEIGGTYIEPSARGGRINGPMKRLMIDHALACGFTRVEFRIDTRNARSMAAVAKLGAVHEGTLRKNRITWTGYVRDTAVFSILAEEWNNRT